MPTSFYLRTVGQSEVSIPGVESIGDDFHISFNRFRYDLNYKRKKNLVLT